MTATKPDDAVTCEEARAIAALYSRRTHSHERLLRFIDQAGAAGGEHTALRMSHAVTVTERNLLRTRNTRLRAACEAECKWLAKIGYIDRLEALRKALEGP